MKVPARAIPRLNYEDVSGLPADPTPEQEALASIAQSLKRIADSMESKDDPPPGMGGSQPAGG